jgi:hypothetical protein
MPVMMAFAASSSWLRNTHARRIHNNAPAQLSRQFQYPLRISKQTCAKSSSSTRWHTSANIATRQSWEWTGGVGHLPLSICVFDTEKEFSAVVASKEIVEKRSAAASDVQVSCSEESHNGMPPPMTGRG